MALSSKDESSVNEKDSYLVLPSFLSQEEQCQLVSESLSCHARNAPSHTENDSSLEGQSQCPCHWQGMEKSVSSKRLELGVKCGNDLSETLPFSVRLARRAFLKAAVGLPRGRDNLLRLSRAQTALYGVVLLYGPKSYMKAHYDAPSQPGQREEWLVMFTIGNDVVFRCNDKMLTLQTGDALVMDSMAVLHGVDQIVPNSGPAESCGLPVEGSRLGILLWQGRSVSNTEQGKDDDEVDLEEIPGLFGTTQLKTTLM